MLGAIISGAAGLAGNILTNKANKKEAEANRAWQEEMSNTSVGRRMMDLRREGLNPLLAVSSASSGASTPSGAQATYDYSGAGNSISNALQLDMQKKANDANVEKTEAETKNIQQKTLNEELEATSKRLNNILAQNDINMLPIRNKILVAQSEQEVEKSIRLFLENKKIDKETERLIIQIAQDQWNLDRDKRDIGQTEQGLAQKHYSSIDEKGAVLGWVETDDRKNKSRPRSRGAYRGGVNKKYRKGGKK